MFGYYTNKRLSENESKLLHSNPDDYNWYMVIIQSLFADNRFFQIREDIKLPQSEDEDGVVLIFEDESVVYFKTANEDITNEVQNSIFDVCYFLKTRFNKPIKAYVACKPNIQLCADEISVKNDVQICYSSIENRVGEKYIDDLDKKLRRKKKFNVDDSFHHILLPFVNYRNRDAFQEKYQRYMNRVNSYDFH